MAVKDLSPGSVATLTDGATVNTDAATALLFRLAAGGDRTLAAPSNAVDTMRRTWEVTASGAQRVLTVATGSSGAFELSAGLSAATTIPSGKVLFIFAVYSSARARWTIVGMSVTS